MRVAAAFSRLLRLDGVWVRDVGLSPTASRSRWRYLAITRAQRKWRHAYNWSAALIALRIHFGDRLPDTEI